ncbi:MAG: carbonic anhydrase [Alphaproteobacteria bacterium]
MTEISKLLEGYKRFYKEHFKTENPLYNFDDLGGAQSPETLVISCSDSRVDPAILTNAGLGDIFVVRNVANLVPPYEPMWDSHHGTSAALEFAVNFLNVKNIVVMGHSNCGGIKTLVDRETKGAEFSFIADWIRIARQARESLPEGLTAEEKYCACEKGALKISLKNLMTFPWIHEKVMAKELTIHGWYFSIKDGSLLSLNQETGVFEPIE